MNTRKSAHPDLDRLTAFGLGRLGLAETAEIESHVADCDSCCRALDALPGDAFVSLLRAVGSPPEIRPAPWGIGEDDGDCTKTEGLVGFDIPSSFIQSTPSATPLPKATLFPAPTGSEVTAALSMPEKYRVLKMLGIGGMGAVYLAEHQLMHRLVALKVINRELMGQAGLVERFRREVHAAARLSHPNIVVAHDAEQFGAIHFLVMEFVEGTDLGRLVEELGPLPAAQASHYAMQAAQGLQHAHENGMVHRDIKPQNLMVTPRGQVKVLDFGLARLVSEVGHTITASGIMMGTPDYLAPEQAVDAHSADIRADIYSLGCTLYHLLAGRPPFTGGSLVQKLIAHAHDVPRPMTAFRADLPSGLGGVLDRMMAKDPAQRYQTPAEVARALAPFAVSGAAVESPQPTDAADTLATTQLATLADKAPAPWKFDMINLGPPALDKPGPVPRRRRLRPAVKAAAALLLVGAMLLALAVYRIHTDKGELIIEATDSRVTVIVEQDGERVTIIDPLTQQKIELRPGNYQLRLSGRGLADLRLSTDKFTLKRGDKTIVKVWRESPGPAVGQPEATQAVGLIRRFVGHTGPVNSVTFSPDGRRALSGSAWPQGDQTVRLWDVETGRELRRFEGHTDGVLSIAFSSDGRRALSGSCDKTMRLWDVETGQELRHFEGHTDTVQSVVFSPDGRRALSGSLDKTMRLWDVETGQERRRFEGHTEWVRGVAFAPDGRRALSGSYDKTMRLWDVETGQERRRFEGHSDRVGSVAFAPDGRRALSGSDDRTVRLWGVETGLELRRFEGHTKAIHSVAFAPDGRRVISGGMDHTMRLWDVDSGRELQCFEGHIDYVNSVTFSPDGRRALSGGGGIAAGFEWLPGSDFAIRLWALPAPDDEVRRFEGHTGPVMSVTFSPDGRRAISGSGGPGTEQTMRLWDVETGRELRRFEGHHDGIASVAFSPDGRRAISGSGDKTMRLWDVETGRELRRFDGHTNVVASVAFSPDGRRAISGSGWPGTDRTVRLWDVETGLELRRFEGHTEAVGSVDFSPDGRRALSGSWDKTVRLWDVETGRELRRFDGHARQVGSVAFAPDGRRALSGSWDKTVRLWDVETGRELRRFDGHSDWVNSVKFSPDGHRALSGSLDKTVRLWDVNNGKELRRCDGHADCVWSVAFSPDGRHALSGGGGLAAEPDWLPGSDFAIRLWALPAPDDEVRRFEGHTGTVRSVEFSPDGRRALSSGGYPGSDWSVRLWDAGTGRELRRFEGHTDGIESAAFSPDGRQILSGSLDKTMRLWDVETGRELHRFGGHTGGVESVAFSPDGHRILSGAKDKTLRLWDVKTGQELRRLDGNSEWVVCVAFAPDGRRALSGGVDCTMRLWDVETGQELRRFEGHGWPVVSLAFSPDGRHALSGCHGTMRLWDVESGKELQRFETRDLEGASCVAFSPEGHRALSGGSDRTMRLWDVKSGKELQRFEGHANCISAVAFSPDGRQALSGGGGIAASPDWLPGTDFAIRLWALPAPDGGAPQGKGAGNR